MTRIVQHRAMTIDRLRAATRKALEVPRERPCPGCNGSGSVHTPMTVAELAEGTGTRPGALQRFLNGKGQLRLDVGLALVARLEELEAAPDPRAPYTDEAPRHPDTRPALSERQRQLQATASRASASAAIDAINRPLQTRP